VGYRVAQLNATIMARGQPFVTQSKNSTNRHATFRKTLLCLRESLLHKELLGFTETPRGFTGTCHWRIPSGSITVGRYVRPTLKGSGVIPATAQSPVPYNPLP